jgi:hypothetical protein
MYLEVFWDGMHRGPLTLCVPFLYWFKALTYSNLAGQIGLRALLNKRPPDLPVLFITHSRGAGVALSCVSDPIWDDDIEVPEHEAPTLESAPAVALICLAPAVGNGHPLPGVRSALPSNSALGIGFNAHDPALKKSHIKALRKSIIDERNFGDTSFGTNEEVFKEAEGSTEIGSTWLYRSVYENYNSHALQGYLEHDDGQPFNALLDRALTTLRLS